MHSLCTLCRPAALWLPAGCCGAARAAQQQQAVATLTGLTQQTQQSWARRRPAVLGVCWMLLLQRQLPALLSLAAAASWSA